MRVCGIDPGDKGAMCVLDSNDPAYLALLDLDKATMYEAAKWMHRQKIDVTYLENVHSLFGMSAKSNFTFGKNLGIVTAIVEIISQGKPPIMVTPKVWQKFVGVTVKGEFIKKQVAEIATKLYPSANVYGPKGGLKDGRSDSICIANFGLHHKEVE